MEKTAILLNRKIRIGNRAELLASARKMLHSGGAIATVNPIMLTDALENTALAEALDMSLCIPDGIGIKKALAGRGIKTDVLPGIELCEALLDEKNGGRGVTYGIVGGKAGIAEKAGARLSEKHRTAKLLFTFDGYAFSERAVAERIESASPDLVFVCLGSPKQKLFISSMREKLPKPLYIGLGGSLDVFSGELKRAPRFIRRAGLEWFWRMANEPKRFGKIPVIIKFLRLCREERKAHAP